MPLGHRGQQLAVRVERLAKGGGGGVQTGGHANVLGALPREDDHHARGLGGQARQGRRPTDRGQQLGRKLLGGRADHDEAEALRAWAVGARVDGGAAEGPAARLGKRRGRLLLAGQLLRRRLGGGATGEQVACDCLCARREGLAAVSGERQDHRTLGRLR